MSRPWSRKHERCVECLTTNHKHQGSGLCVYCYHKKHAAENPEAYRQQKRAWYQRQGGRLYAKMRREQKHFGGNREIVLLRDGYRCTECGGTNQLCVHHRDWKGRGHPTPDNHPDNLITLCNSCHLKLHGPRNAARTREHRRSLPWGKYSKVPRCIGCGTTARKHYAFGLCYRCWKREYRIRTGHK